MLVELPHLHQHLMPNPQNPPNPAQLADVRVSMAKQKQTL